MPKKSTKVQKTIIVKGYKVFDEQWKCQGFQYTVGQTYIHEGDPIQICERGFHFCKNMNDCFNYKSFDPKNKVAEIEAEGSILEQEDKCCCAKITIVKEITWNDMLNLINLGKGNTGRSNSGHSNSGDRNSGDRNSGHSNSGHSNSGDSNSGDRNSGHSNSGDSNSGDSNSGHSNSGDSNSGDSNSGDRNSGDSNSGMWNQCNNETGYLNTIQADQIRVFNKLILRRVFQEARIPNYFYFPLNQWIYWENMTPEEKQTHPKAEQMSGYLKLISYKDAWRASWDQTTLEDKQRTVNLPNWDNAVFLELTGIDVEKELKLLEDKK